MRTFFTKLALAFTPLLCSIVFVFYIGETIPMSVVVDLQASGNNILYGQSFLYGRLEDYALYKVEMINHVQPDILWVGSSRSVGFQAPMFRQTFYNASYTGFRAGILNRVLRQIPVDSLPDIIFLEISSHWFDDDGRADFEIASFDDYTYEDILLGGTAQTIFGVTTRLHPMILTPSSDGWWLVGYRSRIDGFNRGVRPDGSLYRGSIQTVQNMLRTRLPDYIERLILREGTPFRPHYPTTESKAYIIDMLQYLSEHDVMVIGVMLPYEPLFYNAMALQGNTTHFDRIYQDLQPIFQQYGGDLVNYTNPAPFTVKTLDFMDGWHASERVAAQIVQQLGIDLPDKLTAYIDIESLVDDISAVNDPYDMYYSNQAGVLDEIVALYTGTLDEATTPDTALLYLINRSLALNPTSPILYYLKGDVLSRMGDETAAAQSYEEAETLGRNNADYREFLSRWQGLP